MDRTASSTIPPERVNPSGTLRVPHHLGAIYVGDYNLGWRDSQRVGRGGSAIVWETDTGTRAYEDGYIDHAAGREKWHLAHCTAHSNDTGGCGRA